jgi:predicted nucleic acid-binding protein
VGRSLSRVALDTSALIYLVEGSPALRAKILDRIADVLRERDGDVIACRLARLECRVRPLRAADDMLLASYDAIFAAARFSFVELTASVVERATALRAEHGLKTPDALHLAAAIESSAVSFVTGDVQLTRCRDVRVEVVGP